MGMDLGGGFGAGGAVAGLQQLIAQREAARRLQLLADQQAWMQQFNEKALAQQDELKRAQLADLAQGRVERAQQMAANEADRRTALAERAQRIPVENAAQLAPTLPINQNVSPQAAGILRTGGMGGQLFTPPAEGETESGQPFNPETANPAVNLGTFGQQKDLAAEAQRAAAATALQDYRKGQLENAATMNDIRGRMADIAAQNADLKAQLATQKAAQGPKLTQRDNDTVVTVHQMMPLVNQAVSTLEQRVKGKPPAQGGLLGTLKQIPEKIERGAQSAAYSAGLGQPSDISNQIQLESLMQVMGSTPYLRGSRNYELVKQIQKHLADPAATDEANLDRLRQLQKILPGIEQAIYDVENHGVIPHEHTGAMAPVQEYDWIPGKGLVPRKP